MFEAFESVRRRFYDLYSIKERMQKLEEAGEGKSTGFASIDILNDEFNREFEYFYDCSLPKRRNEFEKTKYQWHARQYWCDELRSYVFGVGGIQEDLSWMLELYGHHSLQKQQEELDAEDDRLRSIFVTIHKLTEKRVGLIAIQTVLGELTAHERAELSNINDELYEIHEELKNTLKHYYEEQKLGMIELENRETWLNKLDRMSTELTESRLTLSRGEVDSFFNI